MPDLNEIADALGVRIEYAELAWAGRDGDYHHATKTIRLQQRMSERLERSVLAHELAHAVFGDVPSKFGPVNAKQERRADEWAALLLIPIEAYREVERLRDGHVASMAHDLGVVSHLVEAFQRLLVRVGDTTYVAPRMGAGQHGGAFV